MKLSFSFMRGTVARRILGLFLACALLPIGALAVLSLREMSGNLRNQADQRLRHASKNVGMTILQGFSFLQGEMEGMALSSEARPDNPPGGQEENRPPNLNRHFLGMTHFRDRSVPETHFGPQGPPPPATEETRKHLASGQAVVFVREVTGAPARVYLAVPFDRRMPEKGILVGEINPDYLAEVIENSMSAEGNLTVLDSNGVLIYGPRALTAEVNRRVAEESRLTHAGQFEWDRGDDTFLVNYRSIFFQAAFLSGDWTVVVSQSKANAFAPVRSFTRTFVLVVVLTLLVVSLLGIVQIRKNLIPLAKLKEGTRKIGEGDFTSRIEFASGDEFEELAHSFNAMTNRLGKEFHALNETGRIVRSVLTGLEKEKIVDTVLSNLTSVIPCATVALSLMDPGGEGTARTYAGGSGTRNTVDSRQHPAVFTPEELRELKMTDDHLIVEEGREFQGLLSPLSEYGATRYVLLPLLHKEGLAGVLVMGYGPGSKQAREDLIRARQIADQVAVALDNACLVEELAHLNLGALTALARVVDANSPWTAGHSERVTALSMNIGRAMGLTASELDLLHRGGLLHDIGKIGVPGHILDKPQKLTEEEFAIIKNHPGNGALILEPIPAFREILPIVAQHHEWVNGRGYPRGLAGDEISQGGRIVAVADVYDALTSERPYRAGWHPDRALSYLEENAGIQFDPGVVKAFKNIVLAADAVERFPQEVQIACPGV